MEGFYIIAVNYRMHLDFRDFKFEEKVFENRWNRGVIVVMLSFNFQWVFTTWEQYLGGRIA